MQFGLTKDKFLAAADDHVIKIWDMDKVELLTTIDAEGGLPVSCSVFKFYFLRVLCRERRMIEVKHLLLF